MVFEATLNEMFRVFFYLKQAQVFSYYIMMTCVNNVT